MIWIGGIALLAACATDVLAVIGRHVGLPVRGSIELVQACVLVAGGVALIIATQAGSHARVHLVVDRIGPDWRRRINRASALLGALFAVASLVGCLWIAIDLWGSQEVSELLNLPYRLLRMVCNLCLALVALAWLRRAWQQERS
ncbi:MAG: TRAP transporter small permease subunit [Novosphingobium sp.]|nr:TRAP transporter small permease subunit [Novosphingobium sp.]